MSLVDITLLDGVIMYVNPDYVVSIHDQTDGKTILQLRDVSNGWYVQGPAATLKEKLNG